MQRITYNRTKEPRREKIIRSRRDDDEFADEPPSRRSSSERPNSFVRFKENVRSNTQASMVYRRGKVKGDGSPGRFHTDSKSVYARSTNSRDYVNKRSFLDKNYIIDENRLGIYLNRLLRDEDKERQATLIRQLRAVFEHPENYMMIITEKEDIIRTFEDFIQLGLNTELKYEFIQTVGSLGAVLGYKAKRLLDWEFSVLSMSKCEDIRILILKTILQTLKTDADKKNLSELVPLIMNKLQSALEVADVPELLISIVNVVSEIANGYPNIFSKHFSDIVDILIGWHIDATQQPAVIKFTSDILISFRQFWMSDINFTITLLGQFLEDMESYAEELVHTKLSSQDLEGQFCSPEENLAKIRSLIRVLITVLRSVGDLVVIDDASGISSTFIMGMLKGFLKHVKITTDFCFFPDLITSANQCLVLLLKMAQFNTSSATNQLMDYIDMLQSENSDYLLYESHLVSVLSVMIRFVKSVNTQLPVAFVTQMFSPNSITKRICLSPSLKIQKLLVELYHVVLAVKNVQIVEKFYECILSDLMDAYAQLTSGSDALKVNLLQNICALVEIGNVKHSLIRMFALKPSFFELMTTHLKPTLPQLAKTFPALQSSILFILYSHCQRHSHFVNNSDLVNPDGSGHNSTMLDVRPPSPSCGNLEKLVALLIELLESQDSSHDSRLLASKWTYEILESIQRHLPRLLQTEPFSSLLLIILNSAFVNIPIISKICCKSLHIIFKSSVQNISEDIIQRCYDLCILRINSHDTELQELFASLYALLPLDVVIRGTSVNVSKGLHWGPRDGSSPLSVLDLWTALRGYMSRSSPGNFFTQHFRIVTSFILHGKEPQEKNWLQRLYHSCPPPERSSKVDLLFSQLSKASSTALWFWAVWEVAQSCVTSKLRTPLGKPQETFMAIEGALKIAAKPLKNLDNICSEPKHLTILRYNLLLNLIEQLEKQMYNAYEGCANALPTPPKNVRTFFRTNKSTCQEWLSRVRSTVVLVALQAGRPAVALRHGYHLLEEWKSAPTPEVESVLYGIVKALIQLHCPEGVLGLYLWCKENFNRKYPWIKASIDCAAGRLEMGITEYISIFENEKKSSKGMEVNDKVKLINIDSEANKVKGKEPNSIDVHLHSFLINQIVESYAKLQNWSEATRWCGFLEQVKFNQNGLSIQVSNSSNNTAFLKCLMSFEEASSSFTKKDASTCLNNLTNSESAAWSMDEQFGKVQKSLMSIVITKTRSVEQINELVEQMSEAKTNLLRLMRISSLNWPLHIDADQVCLFMSASSFHPNQRLPSHLLRENIKFDPSDCNSSMFGFLLNWENIWLHLSPTNSKLQGGFFDLLMTTARLARKQQNYIMCQKLTIRALTHLCKNNPEIRLANNPFAVLIKETLGWKPTESLVRVQRESAKLLHCLGDKKLCCEVLQGSIVSLSGHLENSDESFEKLAELNSRCLLNLVKYAQLDPKFHSTVKETAWQSLCDSVKDLQLTGVGKCFEKGLQQEKIVSDVDYQTGQLLQLSVHQCPSLAKSWYSFASWCYAHGKKVVNTASNGSLCILPEEKTQLLALAPNAHKEDIDVLMNIVTSLHNPAGSEWDNQEMDYTESGAEEIRSQLTMYCPFLLKLENHEMVIETIVDIWKNLVSRGYSYYRVAASAYLQFLKLNEKAHDKDKVEDDNVTTTLRLLRLVVKHASELRDILEDGLAQTPTAPWRGIIPQLFSRLNHPEPYVRQSISDLLCRVAQGAPHLIVFPAVVGSLAIKARPQLQDHDPGLLSAYFEGSEEGSESPTGASDTEEDSEEDGQKMRNCFAALVETLCAQDERTIREAKTLVHELHRITLLWDELWLGTLGMHQGEVNRRFLNLEKEITKVINNSFLSKDEKRDVIKEKHHVYVKPTLFLLEQLETISNQPAETPHEQWFQKTFKEHIETAMEKLRNPDDPSRPQESWAIFKQLYQLLQQKVQQQSRSQLSMSQMSPVLSSLQSTLVPMPGVNRGPVTVHSVHNAVAVLPTKTKPKKLAFIGSDGHKYTYLFKGLEDLHLDERIMQFLSIVNNMFAKSKKHGKQVFYARHYSVTPLGPRSGLIQWVDGATPLFGLYKRWQQREAANAKNSSGSNASQMLRPSEIFYNKLTPLLKEKNINSLDNRKEWPLSVLLDVLKQLQEETPDNLLAKELWCSCSSAEEWWNVTLTYNHSTAVMSIIGYIIGLGDRHLDNVLVDLSTGEVVHIDYNVCFEKGKNLRVPEKVPFRMTPNLKTALGLTGIEGVFRVSCEHVLRVLRKGRESLLTLLEAFVYDPLVEWTPGSEGGYTGAVYGGRQAVGAADSRRAMDAHIAHSMLAIRVAEMKGEWLQNRDDLLAAFPKLETLLQDWKSSQHELQIVETALQEACQEKALLEEALTNPNHSLYTVPKRYDEAMAVKTTINATKDAVSEKLSECKKWHTLHSEALSVVCGSELSKRCGDIANDQNKDILSVSPVSEFLQTAGQGQLVQQCEHAEGELATALQNRCLTMRTCTELLSTYAAIILQLGPSYKEQNRCYKWDQWLESLLADFTSRKCGDIKNEFMNEYLCDSPDRVQMAASLNLQLQTMVAETNTHALAVLEKMRLDSVEDKNALVTFVEETKQAIIHYLKESGKVSHSAFLCALSERLCTFQKKLFFIENTAGGDRPMDLTLWNGDRFLNEMSTTCASSANCIQLLLDSSVVEKADIKSVLQGSKLSHFVFSSLEDLNFHFQTIILSEAVQRAMEPSVLEMVAKLGRIIARCGMPLEKIVSHLESLIIKAQVTENRVSDTVKKLRNEFESLMQRSEPQFSGLTQGQMLLMGFNGLFTKVDSDVELLLSYIDNFAPSWQKTDTAHASSRSLLKELFFVKKLLAMQQSFHLCHSFASLLQLGSLDHQLPNNLQLIMPIRQFTSDYVRHMMLGLPSRALCIDLWSLVNLLGGQDATDGEKHLAAEDALLSICKRCIEENFLEPQLPSLRASLQAFVLAVEKEDLARRYEQDLVVTRGTQQRMQLQVACFQWLKEDVLLQSNGGNSSRGSLMSEIRKSVGSLSALDAVVNSQQERYLGLTASIEQRLKWAAGANPSLSAMQEEFQAAIQAKSNIIASASHISRDLMNVCNSVLHFEALRTRTSESISSDNTFLELIKRCKKTCELAESCQSQISSTEEHLISLKPLEKDGVTPEWLTLIIQRVSQSLSTCREKLEQQKTATNVCWDSLQLEISHVHDLISVHHKLMSEVRHILRNLAKHEEQELGPGGKNEGPVHQYMSAYRDFSEQLSAVVSGLPSEDVPHLPTTNVYDQLIELAGPLDRKADSSKQVKKNLLSPMPDSSVLHSQRNKTSRSGTPSKSLVVRDPRTGKAVQERNTYATNVWKRIKMKLDGKDPEPSKKSTLSEQVDFVIREATHPENLAVLYEGWTPWV